MIRPYRTIAAPLAVVILAWGSVGWARNWTSADGKFRIEADMVRLADGKVSLKRSDGRVVDVPLTKLSREDQRFARKHAETLQATPAADGRDSADGGATAQAAIAFPPRPQQEVPQTGAFTMTASQQALLASPVNPGVLIVATQQVMMTACRPSCLPSR